MADSERALPNLADGVDVTNLQPGGMLHGRVGDQEVVLARNGDNLFAVGAHCTHYHGPLADGIVVGDTVRCPWHHACFSLQTGEALRPPALDPVACWTVERQGNKAVVREKRPERAPAVAHPHTPASVVIVGGGAAGLAAADMLRRSGYSGPITMFSADAAPPVDRPNLSKDFLAGTAQEDWIPLKSPDFYKDHKIELVLGTRVSSIDLNQRRVMFDDGASREFGSLLLATGADPVRLSIPGADGPHVHYLRTFADSQAIIEKAKSAKHALVVGASFIGLEVAASLRARNIAVDVVAPEHVPLEHVMGLEVGRFIQHVHESHGVVFHLGQSVTRIDGNGGRIATLGDGSTIDADFMVFGVGVRPAVALAEGAGLETNRGIAVNQYLETSEPGIFAAGDIARWPDPHSGDRIRVEHWVVAERQGQSAARNILGYREPFEMVPFFWSQHYDVTINYVGHAEKWDRVDIDGALDSQDCAITYMREGRTLAVATIGRDRESLLAEVAIEKTVEPVLK